MTLMNNQTTSLQIQKGETASAARLLATSDYEDALRTLVTKFRTGRQRSACLAELDIDDLLVNLAALSTWPDPDGVVWDVDLAALAVDVTHDADVVEARLSGVSDPELESTESVEDRLGADWKGELTDFQLRDIAHLLSLRHGANFSVPGAGKTRVGLAVFQALKTAGEVERLLVVSPKSAFESWEVENPLCLRNPLQLEIFNGSINPVTDALIVNYERLPGALNTLAQWVSARPTLLILDEAHRMKLGPAGVYGSCCLTLGPRARRRLILTGTPAPNGARDLENLFGFVWPGHGRETVVRAVAGGDLVKAGQALRPLFTRTTKDELGLLDPITTQRIIPLPPLHREIYDALIGQYSARAAGISDDLASLGRIVVYLLMAAISPALLSVGTTVYEPIAFQVPPLPVPDGSHLLDLMHDLPSYELSPKYQETLAIVASNAAQGRKTLVWSTFIRSIKTLDRLLTDFKPAIVYGGTEDRAAQIDRFRHDPDCMVLLSNPATLGEGISLHKHCHDAVYVDRDFAAGRFIQSVDRIHRLGLDPDTETRVTVLISERTVDEVVAQRLQTKLEFMRRILDDPGLQQLADLQEEPAIGGGLDPTDLQALLGHLHAGPS